MSSRSVRTDDGTPLCIIQDELFELQRRRRQTTLETPPGPPPDMPYYATVAPPQKQEMKIPREYEQQPPQQQPSEPKPIILKKPSNTPDPKRKKAAADPVQVGLQDPTDITYDVPLVQERASSESLRRVKIGLVLTLLVFICLYVYPVATNVPANQRASALATLTVAIGVGALGAAMWPVQDPDVSS